MVSTLRRLLDLKQSIMKKRGYKGKEKRRSRLNSQSRMQNITMIRMI